jgi:DNA-binding GntR family transcriptional regulator
MIDRLSPMPMYAQLADELAAAIDVGELKDGDRLPTESQLEREHGLARGTVRSGIKLLRKQGLAYTIQARGTFVGRPPQAQ